MARLNTMVAGRVVQSNLDFEYILTMESRGTSHEVYVIYERRGKASMPRFNTIHIYFCPQDKGLT